MKIRIGTRGSKLALWQAEYVADLLAKGNTETEIIKIETRGDKKLNVAIADIGTRGVFTEEIETQLAEGTIDIAVHSAKDLQSELPEIFELLAFTEREQVNDVLIGHDKAIDLENPERSLVLGTSSARRKALLKHYYPHIKTVEIRGNLQTRIAKMEAGLCDATLLAYAGVHRMGYDDLIIHQFPVAQFTPAVGQGSIAVEALKHLPQNKKEQIRKYVNNERTEHCLLAERAFLRTMRGGCSIPAFAWARLKNNTLHITGGIVSLDGQEIIREHLQGEIGEAADLGAKLATLISEKGGKRILENIRKEMEHN